MSTIRLCGEPCPWPPTLIERAVNCLRLLSGEHAEEYLGLAAVYIGTPYPRNNDKTHITITIDNINRRFILSML